MPARLRCRRIHPILAEARLGGAKGDFVLICWEHHLRKLVVLMAVLMLAGCATASMNGGQQASDAAFENLPQPRTPDIFRKPPPQVGRWGYQFGYGGRY